MRDGVEHLALEPQALREVERDGHGDHSRGRHGATSLSMPTRKSRQNYGVPGSTCIATSCRNAAACSIAVGPRCRCG